MKLFPFLRFLVEMVCFKKQEEEDVFASTTSGVFREMALRCFHHGSGNINSEGDTSFVITLPELLLHQTLNY